jgi:hypothetical protein
MGTVKVTGIDGPNGLNSLIADLRLAALEAPFETRKVVQKGSLNIKNDWRNRWSGLKHAPSLASSITYDTSLEGTKIEGEIGPEHGRRQASLAGFIENEYGSRWSAPRPGGAPALKAEEPRFLAALEGMSVRLLDKQ